VTFGAELRFAINIEYYHGFMGSVAAIPDGFTTEGENYVKTVPLTDNNYQLTADGKGIFIAFQTICLTPGYRFYETYNYLLKSDHLSQIALINLKNYFFKMSSTDLKM